MIEFRCSHRKKDGTPVVKDTVIQEYAEAVLRDYKPKLLEEPGAINAVHFLESYLGATVDYQDIYYEEGSNPIAGATVFNDDRVSVFDRENMCIRDIDVCAGTILIDNETMKDGKEGFSLFTHLHEGGHFLIHPAVYCRMSNQLTLFDFMEDNQGSHIATCRRNSIIGSSNDRPKLVTEEDFREHQANTFAAAIAMPRQTFIPLASDMICQAGEKRGVWIEGSELDWEYDFMLDAIIEDLADIFGVSRAAAKVQLKRQHLLITQNEYLQQRNQMAVAF